MAGTTARQVTRTPAERFRLRAVEAPDPVVHETTATPEEAVAVLPLDGHLSKVDGNGRIIFAGTRYRARRALAGELVSVQIDGDIVRIFHNGAPVRVHPRAIPWRKRR
jgi:hypothetical protein